MNREIDMRLIWLTFTIALLTTLVFLISESIRAEPGIRLIEDFSTSTVGHFPSGWKKSKDNPPAPYAVMEEAGERFLHVLDRGESIKIVKKAEWDPREYPFLKFRWRVRQLPPNANEKVKNDSAAGVYVVFERKGIQIYPNAVKYVWSTGLPLGEAVRTGRGYNQIVVVESGEEKKGRWIGETVNVCRDYRRFFGKTPPDVQAIGILTDANATDSMAEADYDDFSIEAWDGRGLSPCDLHWGAER